MSVLHKEKTLPITWRDWDEQDVGCLQFYKVVFLADFGPWKKEQMVETLTVDHQSGHITEHNEDGVEIRGVKVKYVPVE